MNAIVKHSEERLMKVLLAPVISEKATFVAEKNEQVVFLVAKDATKLEVKGLSADAGIIELCPVRQSSSVMDTNVLSVCNFHFIS